MQYSVWQVPHGQGKMDYSIGAVYDGHWENGQWDGYGSYIYVSGTKYTGEWKAGKRHGYGRHVLSNGLVFEGCFHDDSTHGTGKLYYQNGNMKFNGIKVKSNWSGALQGYYPNGRLQYDGNAVDNKWEGKRVEYADTEENDVINTECVSNEDIWHMTYDGHDTHYDSILQWYCLPVQSSPVQQTTAWINELLWSDLTISD